MGDGRGAPGRILDRAAKPTFTPLEMDPGDTLRFILQNGRCVTMELTGTSAAPLVTAREHACAGIPPMPQGLTVYHFTASVRLDGHEMLLQRYVGCQESFHEPYVVNGMRIWLDGVQDIFTFITEKHGACRPNRRARFAVQDASLGICPEPVAPWYLLPAGGPRIEDCYRGDDCWMGAYSGEDAHGGLDINMPDGTPVFSPLSVDSQRLADSVARGAGNNRWQGVRRWPDGSTWVLGLAHVGKMTARPGPLRRGALIGTGAGMAVGYREHSHFNFRVVEGGTTFRLDPWMLLWQSLRDRDRRRAEFDAPGPARTGEEVRFPGVRPHPGTRTGGVVYRWTFGDGGFSTAGSPRHSFCRPGIYPVTLVVEDGGRRTSCTRHLTVDGPPSPRPSLILQVPEEPSFRPRPAWVADCRGGVPVPSPHTLSFTAMSPGAIEMAGYTRPGARKPVPRRWLPGPVTVLVGSASPGKPGRASRVRVTTEDGRSWLVATAVRKGTAVEVGVDPGRLPSGIYRGRVAVTVPGAANSPQEFLVELETTAVSPFWHAVVDDRDAGCVATPHFWVSPPYPPWWSRPGHGGRALYNGKRSVEGEFVRFTPWLWGGRYEAWLGPDTPFARDSEFPVRIRHARGISTVMMRPARSRLIGRFDFRFGTGGWVEVCAGGSRGQVVADCVFFIRKGDSRHRTWDVSIPSRVR